MDIVHIQQKTAPLFQLYGVRKASLFGSVARGDNRRKSDIDILVEMPKKSGLFDFLALQSDLEEVLSCRIDLVEYDLIKPRLKQYVLSDQKLLYPQ